MKHPKTVFSVSRIFHNTFVLEKPLDNKTYEKLKENAKRFERFFRQYEEGIYERFDKYLGGSPGEDEIKVWITIKGKFPSISSPLILKYRNDYKVMLYILIHELVHRYLEFGEYYKNMDDNVWLQPGTKSEALIHLITCKVFREFFDVKIVNTVFQEVNNKIIDKKVQEEMDRINLDLDRRTVREYIKSA